MNSTFDFCFASNESTDGAEVGLFETEEDLVVKVSELLLEDLGGE